MRSAGGASSPDERFGAERTGLTNEEIARCNLLVTIPTNPDYSSLNLAMAVQVLSYEIFLQTRAGAPAQPPLEVPLASAAEMTRLYAHIEEVLDYIDFRDRTGGGNLMARIRRLFNRARLDQNEMNILRGILTAVQAKRRPALPRKRVGTAHHRPATDMPATGLPATDSAREPDTET